MEIAGKSWLITGGCGFLGTSLVAYLQSIASDVNIRIMDNLSVGSKKDLAEVSTFKEITSGELYSSPEGVELFVADILNSQAAEKACSGIDIVVHLAANTGVGPSVENPRSDMEANVVGTFNMLDAAKTSRVGKFIFASSGAPIGEVKPPITEDKPAKPVSPYGASKLAGEGYCSAYFRTFGLQTVSLRFGNVYGPRSKHKNSAVAKFLKQALAGGAIEIYGDGNQTRDFLYIDDLIQAVVLAARTDIGTGGEVFQIATYKETTINEISLAIKEIIEKEVGKKVFIEYSSPRAGDVKRNYSDISKAQRVLGYKPVYDLQKGLQQTFKYFANLTRTAK